METINDDIIQAYKFNHDFSINEIYIKNNVKEIGQCAFFRCINLSKVDFEENSKLKVIRTNAFYTCLSLTKICIPDSVVEIEEECFHRCYNLNEVILPKNLTVIKSLTFDHCQKMESIIIPENIRKIEFEAFSNCHSLKNVYMSRKTYDMNCNDFNFIFTSCNKDIKVSII